MHQLPPELWVSIARFLNPQELWKCFSIHRVFYEIALNRRYYEVELVESNPLPLFKTIDNLRNPDVAKRVRTMNIWPLVLHDAIHKLQPKTPQKQVRPTRRGFSKLFRFLRAHRWETSTVTKDPTTTDISPEDLIEERYRSVMLAARGLTNVVETHIHWYKVDGHDDFPDKTLLSAFRPVFGSNLRALFIDMPLIVFAKTYAFLTDLQRLQELNIALSIDRDDADPKSSYEGAIANDILPFINGLSSTLQILSINIYHHLDLSSLFHGLGHFPQLARLSLTIPLDVYHISNPSSLNKLLSNHPDLQELVFRHQPCCRYDLHHNLVETVWVQSCFQGISLTSLKRLSLGLTSTAHLTFVKFMTPLAQTLTTLTLIEPCLHYSDLAIILAALATPRLQKLSLFIHVLSPQLMALLAEKCPNLERLDLSIEKCHASEGSNGGADDEAGFLSAMEMQYITHRQLYDAWKLRDIVVWKWVYSVGRRRQFTLMRAIAHNIPTVTEFDGQGDLAELYTE